LAVSLAGVELPNPLVLASGILGTHASLMVRVARAGAGAITSKSAGPVPRGGHVNPTCLDFGAGLINAVGLANPGVAEEVHVLSETRELLEPLGVPLIASVFADAPQGFAMAARTVAAARPALIEVNISCPNVASEFGEPFAASAAAAAEVTAAVRSAVSTPIFVKLAPDVTNIGRIAEAVEAAGADGITAVNTMPGMAIDVESGSPILSNREGGVSGPALKPVAVRAVYKITEAVTIPVIGTGGVMSGIDALEMISAGATAIGVGSAVYYEGPEVFSRILREMDGWLTTRGMSLDDVRGRSHHTRSWPEPPTSAPVPGSGSGGGARSGVVR
jgi:dihydroorotate dehydrogenase (NAD+) catalytic subunit